MEFKNIFLMNAADGKNIEKFATNIQCLTVNGNIAVNNKNFVIKMSENYNIPLLIDPMSYILQSGAKHLINKKTNELKKSYAKLAKDILGLDIEKINFKMDEPLLNYFADDATISSLCETVYNFQRDYFNSNDMGVFQDDAQMIENISAPYFDMKQKEFYDLNIEILKSKFPFKVFRIIISKQTDMNYLENFISEINESNIEIVEVWVEHSKKHEMGKIADILGDIKKKIFFKFVSFSDMKVLHNKKIKNNIIGFVSAFGYGESRNIYPIGGGLPVNKVYSLEQRTRIQVTDWFDEIESKGINISKNEDGQKFLDTICNCIICNEIINKYGLSSISLYADFIEYERKLKNGLSSKRYAASQNAITLTNYHYIDNKLKEYKEFQQNEFFSNIK